VGFEKRVFSTGDNVRYTLEVVREDNLETIISIERRYVDRGFDRSMLMTIGELGLLAGVATSAYMEHNGMHQMEISPEYLMHGDVIEGLGTVVVMGESFAPDGVRTISVGIGERGGNVFFSSNKAGKFSQLIGICRPTASQDATD
jgi:hypothetical protein